MGLSTRRLISSIVLIGALTLSACTRDRETPEPDEATSEPTIAEPAVTIVPTAAATPDATTEPEETETPEVETVAYAVQPGDTVSTIAEAYGTDSQTIREINLLATDDLQVGQLLRVPNVAGIDTPSPADAETEPFVYVVQQGDTLYSIALALGVSPNEIVAANILADPDNLFVGSELIIPGYRPEAGAGGSSVYEYRVQSGDTLSEIALQFGVSMDSIMEANELPNANSLVVDSLLLIPGVAAEAEQSGNSEGSEDRLAVHEVQQGEFLSSIAEQYGVTVQELIQANDIPNPNVLQPGTRLRIPGVSASEAAELNQVVHTVVAGESLSTIAQFYGVDAQLLAQVNGITNPNLVRLGDQLVIPQP